MSFGGLEKVRKYSSGIVKKYCQNNFGTGRVWYDDDAGSKDVIPMVETRWTFLSQGTRTQKYKHKIIIFMETSETSSSGKLKGYILVV